MTQCFSINGINFISEHTFSQTLREGQFVVISEPKSGEDYFGQIQETRLSFDNYKYSDDCVEYAENQKLFFHCPNIYCSVKS